MDNYQSSIKNYPFYKDSEIEWLGDVPDHWEVAFLVKSLSSLVDYRGRTPKKVDIDEGGILLVTARNIKKGLIDYSLSEEFVDIEDVQSLLNRGRPEISDVLFTTEAPLGEVANVDRLNVAFAQRIIKFSGKKRVLDNYFMKYWLMSSAFQYSLHSNATGSTVLGLKGSKVRLLNILLPPLSEQELIAHYLDTKTAQIDRKIDLLTQKATQYGNLQSLINETVTRGLDKSVPMKDSAIKWIGEMPEHWTIKRLKDIIKNLESGVSVNAANSSAQDDENGVLKTSCVSGFGFDPKENKVILPEEIIRAKCSPRQGNIIISRMNTPELVGASGFINKDYPKLFLPDRLWQTVFYRNPEINSKWLSYLLLETRLKAVISFSATGSSPSMKNLAQEDFLRIKFFIPPLSEQRLIADYLNTKTAQIDQIIQTLNTQIKKLKELRKTLINDVVTGKIKVIDE